MNASQNNHKKAPVEFKCPHPGCNKSKYHLAEHEKAVHGATVDECTKNFSCPLDCGVRAFRTNKELLSHSETVHHEKLGMQIAIHVYW